MALTHTHNHIQVMIPDSPETFFGAVKLSFKVHFSTPNLTTSKIYFGFSCYLLPYILVSNIFVIFLFFQARVEVDPSFVEAYTNDFDDVWNVVTPYGNIVTLELTKNFFNPTITNGWNTLQQYHNFPTNVVVKFAYYGMNIFKVHEFRQVNIFSQLPAFHSRSLKRNEIKFFDIQLREGLTMRNKLVKSTILTLKY